MKPIGRVGVPLLIGSGECVEIQVYDALARVVFSTIECPTADSEFVREVEIRAAAYPATERSESSGCSARPRAKRARWLECFGILTAVTLARRRPARPSSAQRRNSA